jgi:hypothetical protein
VHNTVISTLLLKILLVPMIALWAFHLSQRRFKEAAVRKRIGTLSLTVVFIGGWLASYLFSKENIDDIYLIGVAALAVVVVVVLRRFILPYRLRCVKCGKPLPLGRVLNLDSNTCEACESRGTEGASS